MREKNNEGGTRKLNLLDMGTFPSPWSVLSSFYRKEVWMTRNSLMA